MNASVQDIAAMPDPVLRNLCITQRYHELAVHLRDAGAREDATWCAFAVWASKTAGATIRGEVLPQRAVSLVTDNQGIVGALHRFNRGVTEWALKHLTHDHVAGIVQHVTRDVSDAIAGGNVLVFAELAPLFEALLSARGSDSSLAVANAVASMEIDDPSPVVAAFEAYGDALSSPPNRAQLILVANVLAVAHEQERLQPAIERALSAAITDTLQKVIEVDVVGHVPTGEGRQLIGRLMGDVCLAIKAAWDTALTETIMQLATSTERLDLRDDIPPVDGVLFPSVLSDIEGSKAADVIARWDRTGGSGVPSGAHDWAVLEERMNFIVNLFRSRQRSASLFNPPFSEEQLVVLGRGELPAGPL